MKETKTNGYLSSALLSVFAIPSACLMASCHLIAGNDTRFYFAGDSLDFTKETVEAGTLILNTITKEASDSKGEGVYNSNDVVIEGGTAPRYTIEIKEGYEDIEPYLTVLPADYGKNAVIYTLGVLKDDLIYGICNLYKDTIGFLSGGGNYGNEEIAYSILYTYDYEQKEFRVKTKLEKSLMVAFSDDQVLYWNSQGFYSYTISTETSKYLFKDYAYDTGLQHQSWEYVVSNNDYSLFVFSKAIGSIQTYTVLLYRFADSSITKYSYVD